jgi:hypothetical protein
MIPGLLRFADGIDVNTEIVMITSKVLTRIVRLWFSKICETLRAKRSLSE